MGGGKKENQKDSSAVINNKLNEEQLKKRLKEQKLEEKKEKKLRRLQAKLKNNEERKKLREQKEREKKQKKLEPKKELESDQKRLLEFAFSILISAAVAYLLGSLVSDVPIENSEQWLFFSIIIVICTVGFICYIFDSFPTGKYVFFKTFLIISSTMTIFGFSRFYSFYIELKNPELAVTENSMGINYYTFVGFFAISGVILIIQGIIEFLEKYQSNEKYTRACLLVLSGIFILVIVGAFLTFIPLGGLK